MDNQRVFHISASVDNDLSSLVPLLVTGLLAGTSSVILFKILPLLGRLIGGLFFKTLHVPEKHSEYSVIVSWASRKFSSSCELRLGPPKPFHEQNPNEDPTKRLRLTDNKTRKEVGRFAPYPGPHIFFKFGLPYYYNHVQITGKGAFGQGIEEYIVLGAFSWSNKSVKKLIKAILEEEQVYMDGAISVWAPHAKRIREWGGNPWQRMKTMIPRPVSSICIDVEMRDLILEDLRRFCKGDVYRIQQAPYRRGYLFYGPPGTGKTSLSIALCGELLLNIYVINVSGTDIDNRELARLIQHIPERSVLLLEDIDTAKFTEEREGDPDNDSDSESAIGEESSSKGITLGGLLEALDGVFGIENRVLMMSTNNPLKIDSALIRPGRVDMQVEFHLSRHPQMQEMFLQRYPGAQQDMANRFAKELPEGVFSMAEISGFLVTQNAGPEWAIETVSAWGFKVVKKRELKEERKRRRTKRKNGAG